ncbi:MAG: heat-shock protein [Halobacteriota archaeon]|nr:heat-shock protein [Halobacteriota archaeon]
MNIKDPKQFTRMLTKRYKRFIEALLLSTALAFLMLGIAFGLMYIFEDGTPIPYSYLLLIFALSFIVGSVLFEKQSFNRTFPLIFGGLFSFFATFIIAAIVGGIRYIFYNFTDFEAEIIISALAVCMIISMVIINILAYE